MVPVLIWDSFPVLFPLMEKPSAYLPHPRSPVLRPRSVNRTMKSHYFPESILQFFVILKHKPQGKRMNLLSGGMWLRR
jgi:hypothetical protein